MSFFEDFAKKAREYAEVAADKARDVAKDVSEKAKDVSEKAKDATDTAKINLAIASEKKELEKNYRAIGEWFVSEFPGEAPDAVKDVLAAIAASKAKIAELEASKPVKEKKAETVDVESAEEFVEEAEATKEDFADKIEDFKQNAAEKFGEIKEAIEDKVEEIKDKLDD